MIAVDRTRVAPPRTLQAHGVETALDEARTFFGSRSRAVRQRPYKFEQSWLHQRPVIAGLMSLFSNRCAFCGSAVGVAGPICVHHFRPAQDAVAADGQTSRRHYWWLFYEWENLYPACNDCHRAKGAKFPVARQRARIGVTKDGLDREMPLLLDPCRDDPEEVLVYLDSGEIASRDERGQTTIELFELNRPALVKARQTAILHARVEVEHASLALHHGRYDEFVAKLNELYNPDPPFAAVRRQVINQWAQVRPRQVADVLDRNSQAPASFEAMVGDLTRVTNRVKEEAATVFFGNEEVDRPAAGPGVRLAPSGGRSGAAMDLGTGEGHGEWSLLDAPEIRRVEIRNFRVIDRLSLRLPDRSGPGSWLMLLGENATGKSSVLQAIALALSSEETIGRLPIDTGALLRDGAEEGFVRVELTGSRRLRELHFGRDPDSFVHRGPSEAIPVAGYGSTRLLPRHEDARKRASSFDGLFDPFVPLTRPAEWLPTTEVGFDAIARALKRLLDLDEDEELRQTEDGIEMVRGKSSFSLSRLSDGYQAMAGFGLDMMHRFSEQGWGSLEAAEGIVLVDELGTHLHPRWQMKVVASLREAFPRVQFIATTHDPLCLRGLHGGEVAILRRNGSKTYALQDDLPPVADLAVDQLLTSEHFGLGSTIDPKLEELMERYYGLRAKPHLEPEDREELGRLAEELQGRRLLGTTLRERLALEAADDFIAKARKATSAGEYQKLKDLTRELVSEAWSGAPER